MTTPEGSAAPILLGIMADIRTVGAATAEEIAHRQRLRHMPWSDALLTPWASDAHFVTYNALEGPERTAPSDGIPRLRKSILGQLRQHSVDVVTQALAFDLDNPGHAPWAGPQQIVDFFGQHIEGLDWPWAAWYATRAGSRLLFLLDSPLSVDRAEQAHIWLVGELAKAGLPVDLNCSDWTRVFRLPCVTREQVRTWESDYFCLEMREHDRFPVGLLKYTQAKVSKGLLPALIRPQDIVGHVPDDLGDQPTPEEADALLYYQGKSGTARATQFYRDAKAWLQGRECYPCLFEHQPLADPGTRNATLTQYVGQAVGLLHARKHKGASAAGVYALFLPAVEQLEPDASTPDWSRVLWSLVCRMWTQEEAKAYAEKKQEEQQEARKVTETEDLISKMRAWCDAPEIANFDEKAVEWVERRAILGLPSRGYMVLTKSGYYDSLEVPSSQIISRIRELGMDYLITTRKMREDGIWQDRQIQEILNQYCKPVGTVLGRPQIEGTYLDRASSPNPSVVCPLYRRNKALTPQYDSDVDEWLHEIFGKGYARAAAWIGHALAFEDGPICALSIEGDPGIGKKMLVRGLAECLELPAIADANDLIGGWQYGLASSPFLVINEGWPLAGGRRPIDSFREVVGGDPVKISRKFMAPMDVSNPVRVIFTANNLNVIYGLIQGQELGPGDRMALGERILHFSVGGAAKQWLEVRGGLGFTARKGRRWIASDAGEPSDFVVARHFLWLHENRPLPDARYLVTGNAVDELMAEMRTQSGSSPLVIEIVLKLLESPMTGLASKYAIIGSKLYMLAAAVQDYYRERMANSAERRLTMWAINEVFQSLAVSPVRTAFILPGKELMGRKRWHEMDLDILLVAAQKNGWKCDQVEKLIAKREAEAAEKERQKTVAKALALMPKLAGETKK